MTLFKSASIITAFTLLSRITGLVREQLMATMFGASSMTDAFNVAFRIPNLFRRLFAEGAFSQAFVPVLAEYKEKHGEEATRAGWTVPEAEWRRILALDVELNAQGLDVWLEARKG